MKYKIIGWSYIGDPLLKYNRNISDHIEDIVQREVMEKGYMFGGDAHEDNCPVFNDGSYICYSWRGWEGMMSRAFRKYGAKNADGYYYNHCYMNEMIPDQDRKYPKQDYPEKDIVPTITLAEKHAMQLSDEMFHAMDKGRKCIECRPCDDKTMLIDRGDYIEFSGSDGSVLMRVADMVYEDRFKYAFRYFTNLIQQPFTAESFGFSADTDADAFEKAMRQIYPTQASKHGVVAFVLEKAEPVYHAELNVYVNQWADFLDDEWGLTAEEKEQLDVLTPDEDALAEELKNYGEFTHHMFNKFVRCAEGKDPSKLLLELLCNFLGKEEELTELLKRNVCVLGIDLTAFYPVPATNAMAEEVFTGTEAVHIELDPKIREFCQKTHCRLHIKSCTFS